GKNCGQTPNPTASGGDFILIGAIGVEDARAVLDDIDAEDKMANARSDPGGKDAERQSQRVRNRRQRQAEAKEEERKEAGAQPARSPSQTHQCKKDHFWHL